MSTVHKYIRTLASCTANEDFDFDFFTFFSSLVSFLSDFFPMVMVMVGAEERRGVGGAGGAAKNGRQCFVSFYNIT